MYIKNVLYILNSLSTMSVDAWQLNGNLSQQPLHNNNYFPLPTSPKSSWVIIRFNGRKRKSETGKNMAKFLRMLCRNFFKIVAIFKCQEVVYLALSKSPLPAVGTNVATLLKKNVELELVIKAGKMNCAIFNRTWVWKLLICDVISPKYLTRYVTASGGFKWLYLKKETYIQVNVQNLNFT